ncbi:MAG: hypothetical protein ACXWL5_04295 [Candidatus Chromulinivorax sp.]
MHKNMMMLLLALVAAGAVYYFHQQGYFSQVENKVEQRLHEICDPTQRDCSDLEEDLEV